MRATIIALLGVALLGATLTTLFAAGQGNGQGQCRRQQAGACQLADAPVTTVTGTISDLVLPTPGSRQGPARFTLTTGNTATAVRLGPPQALTAAGVTLTNGMAISVTGWSVTREGEIWLIARDLTIDGTTVALRNADGTPIWQGQGNGGQRGQCAGRGNGQCQRDGSCRQ